jgi:isochorismate hydrolase
VRTTVIDAYQRNYQVWLASNCIASYHEEHHAVSMRYMEGKMGVAMTNQQLEAKLRKHA